MTRMIVTKSCRYGTRNMTAGEEFDAAGQTEIRLYKALGWATEKPAEAADAPTPANERSSDDAPAAKPPIARKTLAAKKTAAKRTYTKRASPI